jgi:plastocyanin
MSAQEKPKSPPIAVKIVVAAVIGLVLLCVSVFLVGAYIGKISGSPGFLGTRASLFADLNLVAEIILLLGLTAGFGFAKLGNIPLHQYNQTAWTLFNIVLTIFIMLVAYVQQVVPGIPADLLRAHGIVSTIHALLGLLTISCAIYIILRMNNLMPKFMRIKWWRGLMRITLALYWIVGLFGIGTYAVWYLTPREAVAVVTPQGTVEPGGKVVVPLANYNFVPGDLTIPVGTTVEFQNVDPDPHTVTFDNNEFPAGGLLPGDKHDIVFDKIGTFQIYCEYHGSPGLKGMSMVVRVVAEGAAIPTAVTVPTATPRPALPPLDPQAIAPNGFGLFQDTQGNNDTFNLAVTNLQPNSAGEYQVWLTGANGDSRNLGSLTPDASNNANLIYFGQGGENLLTKYSGFLITLEQTGTTPTQPSSNVAFGGVIAQGVLSPVRQLLSSSDTAPNHIGYSVGVVKQAEELLRHAVEADRASQGGDLESTNRHLEHLSAILAGKGSPDYIDLTGDGFVDDPGDGFGILNYATTISAQAQAIANAPDASDAIKAHAAQLQQVAGNLTDWSKQMLELRTAAHAATSDADRKASTLKLSQIAGQLLNGIDADNNGTVDAVTGEGGVYVAYFQSQYLAAMGVLTEPTFDALPTDAPPTLEPGQPTPTLGPTNTPTIEPTAGPVTVVFRNFEIVPSTLTIKAGTQIIFQIQGSQHEPYQSSPDNIDITGFDSGPLSSGQNFTMTFKTPGTFTIRCGFHPNKMVMTLTVTP